MATDHDFSATWKGIVDTNWQTGVIAKPAFILARDVRKTRKVYSANTILFYTYERFKPKTYRLHRDYTVIVPVELIGTTLSNHDDMIKAYDDAGHEHLDDATRTFHHIETEWEPHVKTRPRIRYVSKGETMLTVYAENIVT